MYVERTAQALNDNYEEYMRYKEFYDMRDSNLRYYIIKNIGDRQEIYTNLETRGLSEDEINARFKSMENICILIRRI